MSVLMVCFGIIWVCIFLMAKSIETHKHRNIGLEIKTWIYLRDIFQSTSVCPLDLKELCTSHMQNTSTVSTFPHCQHIIASIQVSNVNQPPKFQSQLSKSSKLEIVLGEISFSIYAIVKIENHSSNIMVGQGQDSSYRYTHFQRDKT